MGIFYQNQDEGLFDYNMVKSNSVDHRGPFSVDDETEIASIGSAHTFGRFCRYSFQDLLFQQYGIKILNLGFGGAGPGFYEQDKYIKLLNKHKVVIVQVMSGRSASNSIFNAKSAAMVFKTDKIKVEKPYHCAAYERLNGKKIEPGDSVPVGDKLPAREAWQLVLSQFSEKEVKKLVAETRESWLQDHINLLNKIKGKKILFWYSERYPDYQERYSNLAELFDLFPQLVNLKMVKKLKSISDDYVELVSSTGMPNFIGPAPSGFKWPPSAMPNGVNRSYPSPGMQFEAAEILKDPLINMIQLNHFRPPINWGESTQQYNFLKTRLT